MPSPRIDPSQRAVIQVLLETDDDLRAVARAFVLNGLRELIDLQTRGDPAVRARLALAMANPIVSAISEPVERDEFGSLRDEMTALISEVREAIVPTDGGQMGG